MENFKRHNRRCQAERDGIEIARIVNWWRDPERPGGYGEMVMRCEGPPDNGLWIVELGRWRGQGITLVAAMQAAEANARNRKPQEVL